MRKVLVAESSAPMRKALELAFGRQGLQVVAVSDGTQAIATILTERPDALVVEHALPGRSGVEVSAFLRQQAELKDVPVVLLLGAFETLDRDHASGAGIDEVWIKPVDFGRMAPRLRELAARRTTADTDAYLERLSAALEARGRQPAGAPPSVVAGAEDEPDPAVPTLASILGETPPSPVTQPARAGESPTGTEPPPHRIE
jgi:DNA-binding response OmpR family regulator